jgi:hypothetical protein
VRVELLTPRVEARPGASCRVELEVFNTGEVIDSVTSRVLDHPFPSEQQPATLALFPDSGDRLTVEFTVPDDFAAGSHAVPIEVASTFQHDDVAIATLNLEVAPVISATLGQTPSDITAGKKAKFAVEVTNDGNVPLDLTLTGNDHERVLRFRFEPLFVHVEPGETVHASGLAVGKRPFFGSPVTRNTTILAWGNGLELQTVGRFNQKPRIPRGVLTFLALAGVVSLWAAVIFLGAGLVLDKPAIKKTVPESFLLMGAGDVDLVATAVAGSLAGAVTSNDGAPIERITIEAWRVKSDGSSVLEGSAATIEDGTWVLATVKPGTYHLKFTAPGFVDTWYPAASTEAGAMDVLVRPVAATEDLAVTLIGQPGAIKGAVVAGETAILDAEIKAFQVVDDAVGDQVGPSIFADVLTGEFTVPDLPTPGVYELSVSLVGFDPQTVRVELTGGEEEVINTLNMAAGVGTMSGTVIGPDGALGGVEVLLSGGGQELSVVTPTDGEIGTWLFAELPTPATYLLTFTAEGFGTQTIAIDLAAGQTRDAVVISMLEGTGQVSGLVTSSEGDPLGGVTVSVTGAIEPLTTTTLTTGDVGRYVLTGLPTPGRYTLTFSLEGYSPVTVGVTLADGGSDDGVDAMLQRATSSIVGTITGPAGPVAGATIGITDGTEVRSTVTADDPAGGYRFDGIPAGRYTLTITAPGLRTHTVLVTVARGETRVIDAELEAGT